MNKYENLFCPVCKARLFDDDDIVVCPICGAPHHRDCYNYEGHCHFESAHGTPEQWTPPEPEPEPQEELHVHCKYCGVPMPEELDVCPHCGRSQSGPHYNSAPFEPGGAPYGDSNGYRNPYEQQFAAIDPKESIDEGVTAGDVLNFVGPSGLRYLNVFRKQTQKKSRIGWNWAAFLMPDIWLFSRKMFALAFPLAAVRTALSAMLYIIISPFFMTASSYYDIAAAMSERELFVLLMFGLCSVCMNVFFGIFGDFFYREHSFKKIRALKEQNKISRAEMTAEGSVNILYGAVAYFAEYAAMQLILIIFRAVGLI